MLGALQEFWLGKRHGRICHVNSTPPPQFQHLFISPGVMGKDEGHLTSRCCCLGKGLHPATILCDHRGMGEWGRGGMIKHTSVRVLPGPSKSEPLGTKLRRHY